MYKKEKQSESKVPSLDNSRSPEQIIKLLHNPLSGFSQPNSVYGRQARKKIAKITIRDWNGVRNSRFLS